MTTWYKVGWLCEIKPIDVVKETQSFVVVKREFNPNSTDRVAKRSDHENYFPTWHEARDYLLDRERRKLSAAQLAIDRANALLETIMVMEEPKEDERP